MFEPIQLHHSLSIMPTFRCTAACHHCGTYSSPRAGSSLSLAQMLSAIDQAVALGYRIAVFTGGEATLAGDDLLAAIRHASAAALPTRVVTNAWWATDEAAATEWAEAFVSAGLSEINFSTGDQHARFVPLGNIVRACHACLVAGLRTICIMVELVDERRITASSLTEDPAFQQMASRFSLTHIRILESPWMPISAKVPGVYPAGTTANRENLHKFGGCNSCLNTTTVQADGRLAACCGLGIRGIPELQTGHIDSTAIAEADERGANDFLKRWIRVEGPIRILAWAASHDSSICWENIYAHRCQACLRLYKDPTVRAVVREHHAEKIAEILTKEWLLHHYEKGIDPAGSPAADDMPGAIAYESGDP